MKLVERLSELTPGQQAMVEARVADADSLTAGIRINFPTYTAHDAAHAQNVLSNIENLLGADGVRRLNGLEVAMLVLAAHYHDIGMVVSPDERSRMTDEPEFHEFLETHPDDHLRYLRASKQADVSLEENYFRWRHAERAATRLAEFPPGSFRWGAVSVRSKLADLCRSHNQPVGDLSDLPINFAGSADLRLCGVLLRLGDILDFDSSRTPTALYRHLGLMGASDSRTQLSDREWRKHMSSDGFTFPAGVRSDGYGIVFVAGPSEPQVEHQLRDFLKVIDREVIQCREVMPTCSERWRSLSLPGPIDPSGIESHGYKFGDYRFNLDRSSVLSLFMGESLYEHSDVFVRELIQNSIDATRLRAQLENLDLRSAECAIRIDAWIDAEGRSWFRIDDNGVGMDERTARDYLLRVGKSYYSSSEFQVELLRGQKQHARPIVPISRFGIGVLSCFLGGDLIEISTRRSIGPRRHEPVRISMAGIEDYFTMQTGRMPASTMPSPTGLDAGYRTKAGTTVAVRIHDHGKRRTLASYVDLVRSVLFDCPVDVYVNGHELAADSRAIVTPNKLEAMNSVLGADIDEELAEFLGYPVSGLTFQNLHIDLRKFSPTPELSGILALSRLVHDGAGVLAFGAKSSLARRFDLQDLPEAFFAEVVSTAWTVGLQDHSTLNVRPSLSFFGRDLMTLLQRVADGSIANGEGMRREELLHFPFLPASLPDVLLGISAGGSRHALMLQIEQQPNVEKVALNPLGQRILRFLQAVAERDSTRRAGREGRRILEIRLPEVAGARLDRDEGTPSWCGHNGVAVTSKLSNHSYLSERAGFGGQFSAGPAMEDYWLYSGRLSLWDSLRPDVTVSRDSIREFTWDTVVALALASRRAFRFALTELGAAQLDGPSLNSIRIDDNRRYVGAGDARQINLNMVRSAPGFADDDGWRAERLFRDGSGSWMSASDLIGGSGAKLSWWSLTSGRSPVDWIAAGLLQELVQLQYADGSLFAGGGKGAGGPTALQVFPPLTFVAFADDTSAFIPGRGDSTHGSGQQPLNLDHPVSGWILRNIEEMELLHPAVAGDLKDAIWDVSTGRVRGGGTDAPDELATLKDVLARCRVLYDTDPPPDIERRS